MADNGTPTPCPPEAERKTPLEIWKPPTEGLFGCLDVVVKDPNGVKPDSIIKDHHDWEICCNVWLYGDIWKCVCGYICCEIYFENAADGARESLSDIVGKELRHKFIGCEDFIDGEDGRMGHVHRELCAKIPAGRLPAGEKKPNVYDWTAVLAFENHCGERGVISGYDKGCVQIYPHDR